MHHITSSNSPDVYDFLQDAQEFLEATLEAEKLSLAALEHRSRLKTKLSSLMTDLDGQQAEMYVDMSPTLKLTFKAFESSASENSSLRETQPIAEELYDTPPDFYGSDLPKKNAAERTVSDELDGRAAEVAAAIANASVPKKKKGFIQRLFRTPSKVASSQKSLAGQNYENIAKKDGELYDDISKNEAEVYDDISKKEMELYDNSTSKELNQEDYLAPSPASALCNDTIVKPTCDIYDDVYANETNNGFFENMYQDYEPSKTNNVNDVSRKLEAKENSVNKEFIGNMQEVFDQVGIDANLYDDTTTVVDQRIPMFPPLRFPESSGQFEEAVREENYDCIGGESTLPEPINDDVDNVSVRSATSDYSNFKQTWTISVSEAIKQAIIHGPAKRRNGKKLLSAWRRCYCVLFPGHLLMFTDEGELRPRIVIDLTQPNIEVKKLMKQGSDAKRLKLFPFVLTHENKPLYEISMKTREEAENWVAALQGVLWNVSKTNENLKANNPNEDDSGDMYFDIGTSTKTLDRRTERIEIIQGRNLPMLPQREENAKSLHASKPSLNSLISFSSLKSTGNGNSESERSVESFINKQSSDELISDDFYQELPSPVGTATPYSSIESISSQLDDGENMYNSVENIANDFRNSSATETRSRACSEVINWPPPPPPEDLPVYDVPPTTVRPLGANGNQNVFRYSAVDMVDNQELYDVPATSPRPISNSPEKESELETYDEISTPPRPVVTNYQKSANSAQLVANENAPKQAQSNEEKKTTSTTARFWHDKIATSDKKDTLPLVKCLPQPASESQSVGRSFSRVSPPRAPLASLTELLGASNGGILKPSALRKTQNSKFVLPKRSEEKNAQYNKISSAIGNKLTSVFVDNNPNQKKERPPRPPAPVRTIPVRKAEEQQSLFAELKLRQTAPKVIQNLKNKEKLETDKTPVSVNQDRMASDASHGQYKARWAYVATNLLELSINSGEVVEVLGKNGPCWLVRARNKKGLVPKEYLVPVEGESLPVAF